MGLVEDIKGFFNDFADNTFEDRMIDYIVDNIDEGKSLEEILNAPYVKNRLNEAERDQILNNPEIAQASLEEVREVFESLKKEQE
ncbi:MAG: hypothetical protein Q4E22_06895 [Coriobacteriia bacterium]|nr:hypothetical protein [Coriobacteriia bacterium]